MPTRSVLAQFQEPVSLSSSPKGGTAVDQWAMGVDHFNSVVLAVVEDGRMAIHNFSGQTKQSLPVESRAGAVADPALSFTTLKTHVTWVDVDPLALDHGPDVYVANKLGSILSPPENTTRDPRTNRRPRLRIDQRDRPVIAWTRMDDQGNGEVVARVSGQGVVYTIGPGDEPRLASDTSGKMHLLYRDADGRLQYRVLEPLLLTLRVGAPLEIADQSGLEEPFHDILACNSGEIVLAYSEADTVFAVRGAGGELSAPREIVSGDFRHPHVACNSGGILAIVWEQDGDLWYRMGSFNLMLPPQRVLDTESITESEPQVAIDSYLNLYVTYRQGDELFMTTNARSPSAGFLAEPTEGEAPLRVQFTDHSQGNIFRWHWEFGDGAVSGNRNPEHVYDEPGIYRVTLAVDGPGGASSIVGEQEIRVLNSSNTMTLGSRRAFPGQGGLVVPLAVKHDTPMQGLQIAMSYDETLLELARIDIASGTNFSQVAPELVIHRETELGDGRMAVTTAVIIDFDVPHDGRTFAPGDGQRLANYVFNVRSSTRAGTQTEVRLDNQLGEPPINNIFISGGQTVLPLLRSGLIAVESPAFPPPRFFLRGDANGDRGVNIADGIGILNFLFRGEAGPSCMDAADADDDGDVNISDAIRVLNYLFLGGNYLPAPFPDLGLDPTPDEFPDCRL